MFTLIEPV